MFARHLKPVNVQRVISQVVGLSRNLSDTSKGKRVLKPLRRKVPGTATAMSVPAPAPLAVQDAWTEVVDKQSGQIYYWNTVTNETTALGAPRPSDLSQQQPPQQSGSVMGGLGRVVAEGFAFGVGSSVAHGLVGSMFGGSSSGSADAGDGGDDGFDI